MTVRLYNAVRYLSRGPVYVAATTARASFCTNGNTSSKLRVSPARVSNVSQLVSR